MVRDVHRRIWTLHSPSRRLDVSFLPDLTFSQLIGLAIFGFCTGFGSAFATLTVQFLVTHTKKNAERSFNIVKNHTKKSEED